MDEKTAKALTIWYQVQVPFNDIDLSHLVVELDDLKVSLPYTEIEIEDFRNMSKFDFDEYDNDEGKEKEDFDTVTFRVVLGKEAYQVIDSAIKRIMEDNDCSEARALELLAADYLAGL